ALVLFFSSCRRRHTSSKRDWSSDVCSSDLTSAHDPLSYLPAGVPFARWRESAAADPEGFTARARESMAVHVEAMVGFQDAGAEEIGRASCRDRGAVWGGRGGWE